MMKRISGLVSLTTFALAIPAHAASFDCSKAASKIEKMICQDEELSRLDGQLGEKFKVAVRLSAQPDQLKNAQRSWLGNTRNPCADKPCLVAAYQLRVQELDKAGNLIPPGIYQIDTTAPVVTTKQPPETDNSRTVYRTEHAMPQDARIGFAVIARDEQANLNKVLFLTANDYQYDYQGQMANANRPCPAYAFPSWYSHSGAAPFCRSGFYGGAFTRLDNAFTFSWPTLNKFDHSEKVPAIRKPSAQEAIACDGLGGCSGEAYGYVINHHIATDYVDKFSLKTSKPYQDILYLPREINVYALADSKSTATLLEAGGFVAVMAVAPDWYEIDRISQNGEVLHAWLQREDLIDGQWVTQEAKTEQFSFRVAVKQSTEDSNTSVIPVAIQIIDRKTGKTTQTIYDLSSDKTGTPSEQLLNVVDADFDHHPDIRIFGQSGGAGPNNTDNFFLFNPRSEKFEFDGQLSGLSQIEIDSRQQTISSGQRGGCCSHSSQTYKFVARKLILVADWSESLSADGKWLETSKGKLSGGKMVYHTSKKKAPKDY